jgi:hypothetical protein
MDNDNFDGRLKLAIQSVLSQVEGGKGFGLAITNAANEFSIDRKVLAKKVGGGKKKKKEITTKNPVSKEVSAEWKAADERRYGWMND